MEKSGGAFLLGLKNRRNLRRNMNNLSESEAIDRASTEIKLAKDGIQLIKLIRGWMFRFEI